MQKAVPILFALTLAAFSQPSGRRAEYAVILQDSPVAQTTHSRIALQGSQAKAQLSKIQSAQAGVMAELKRRKVPVSSSNQLLVNAIFVILVISTASMAVIVRLCSPFAVTTNPVATVVPSSSRMFVVGRPSAPVDRTWIAVAFE